MRKSPVLCPDGPGPGSAGRTGPCSCGKEEARDLAKSVGADYVAGDDVADVVTEASKGEGAAAVCDFVGEGMRRR